MRRYYCSTFRAALALLAPIVFAVDASAQAPDSEGFSPGFFFFVLLVAGAAGAAIFFWYKSKTIAATEPEYNYNIRYNSSDNGSYDMRNIDTEMELEWLRKAKKSTARGAAAGSRDLSGQLTLEPKAADDINLDTRVFQEKMRKLQYVQLPINSFSQLAPAKRYTPLNVSDDGSLLNAIEQANEEFEEDEAVRDVALRVLAAFRNRNSAEALSQIALYDLSSNLRSRAVNTLADFDHESVFETILLACADPTREVRAAAARGLFRLGFDRAHAWKRIIEGNDSFLMTQAARAAIESGIVAKSLDRLIHEDVKIAYEAFALVSLLIKSGESAPIFDALLSHKDERVKYALLHVLKVHKDERTLAELTKIRAARSWPQDMAERIRETVKSFETVSA